MRNAYVIILFLGSLISSCKSNSNERVTSFPSSYELHPITKDTINRTNEKGRQGAWLIFDRGPQSSSAYTKCNCDSDRKEMQVNMTSLIVLEKGNYIDNKKQGE